MRGTQKMQMATMQADLLFYIVVLPRDGWKASHNNWSTLFSLLKFPIFLFFTIYAKFSFRRISRSGIQKECEKENKNHITEHTQDTYRTHKESQRTFQRNLYLIKNFFLLVIFDYCCHALCCILNLYLWPFWM